MQIKHRIETLSGTALELTSNNVIDPFISLSIQNIMTSGYAYIGGSNVSTSNYGHKLYPGQSFTIDLAPKDNIYAVGDSGVQVAIFILELG
jgi:hypothetical protein